MAALAVALVAVPALPLALVTVLLALAAVDCVELDIDVEEEDVVDEAVRVTTPVTLLLELAYELPVSSPLVEL